MSPIKEQTSFIYKVDDSAGSIPATVHYKPSFKHAPTPRPVVMIIHAGGYTMLGTYIIPKAQIETLLDMGFVVVAPEFRLCPQVSVADGPLADVRSCLKWIRSSLNSLLKEHTGGVSINAGRVAVMGHSAGGNLALLLGREPHPPNAIFDLYGTIDMADDFYHRPLAAFAAFPAAAIDAGLVAKVHDGPVPFTAPPMIKDGRPDVSTPRNAWMIKCLKEGTHTAAIVPDGDYVAVSGARQIAEGFPPTIILHGTTDVFAPYEQSVAAVENLKRHGVESELITVPDKEHMFDVMLPKEDPAFRYIQQGFDFLKKHV